MAKMTQFISAESELKLKDLTLRIYIYANKIYLSHHLEVLYYISGQLRFSLIICIFKHIFQDICFIAKLCQKKCLTTQYIQTE